MDSDISKKIAAAAAEYSERIIEIGKAVLANPELGFFEEKTSALVRRELEMLGIEYTYPHALTGVKAELGGKSSKYNVCIIGEMDCLKCPGNKSADGHGNAHACGHNAQIAAMLGAAYCLKKSGVCKELDGTVTFMAVPAEEFIDLDARRTLTAQNKISFMSGKQQLIAEGAFDGIDMAMMLHAQPDEPNPKLYVRGHNLGFVSQKITFRGKAAHGSAPQDGINALNAAALAILGVHSNRETFRDEERIRIHPIITKGGDVVNSVPDEVCIESYVRGATLAAIKKGEAAVCRSVSGAAQIIGASAGIERTPGYLPLSESAELSAVMEEAAKSVMGEDCLVFGSEITGSTDMGDLSCIMPVIHPSVGGFCGKLHSNDFAVANEYTAYVKSAQLLALTAAMLLENGAEKARSVKESFAAKMTKSAYINYLEEKI